MPVSNSLKNINLTSKLLKSLYSLFAKVGKTSISVYTSGKVVFQGSDAEKIASEFGHVAQVVPKNKLILLGLTR